MKRLFNVIALTLAMNFLAMAGGVAWLHQTGRLNRERVLAIREILFPPEIKPEVPAARSDADPALPPVLQLDELLARTAGRPATEQVQFLQRTFDAQMTQLERRERELLDLQRQIELARQQLTEDRAALEARTTELLTREQAAARLASDKGFQDSLQLYTTMAGKQVKSIFMTLDDETVRNYLQAMEPRVAARIIKEFKSPDEIARIQRILETMRQPLADAQGKD